MKITRRQLRQIIKEELGRLDESIGVDTLETLESVLTMKCQDTRKALTNELHRVVEEISRHYSNCSAENQRLQQ